MAKILIAAGAQGRERLRTILGPSHSLLFANTVDEALDAAPQCDILVCGLEFDESRMFDFLQKLKAKSKSKTKPCVCVRFFATNTPEQVLDGLDLAVRAVGGAGLLDLPALEAELGVSAANTRVLHEVEGALNGHRR